jgi:xylulokinase
LALIGIDVGTSSVKTMVVHANGDRIDLVQRASAVLRPHAGWAEQDPEILWEIVRDSLIELHRRRPEAFRAVEGLSLSGQMHGLVALDAQYRPIRNAILWCDQRAGAETASVYDLFGLKRFHQITANDLSSGFLLTSLMWMRRNEPEAYSRTRWVVPIKDFIRFRLCGIIGIDHSDASATLAYDVDSHDWSLPVIEAAGLDAELFPPLRSSAAYAGAASGEGALDFLRDVPVFYGAGDSVAQQVGNGIVRPGTPWIANIGTASSLNCVVAAGVRDPEYRLSVFDHVEMDQRMLLGASLSGGSAIAWSARQMLGLGSSAELTELANSAPPGSNGVMFLPNLSGARIPRNDPTARACFVGLTSETTSADVARATLEGVIFQMASAASIFGEMGIETDQIVSSGGGSRTPFLLQLQADILGYPTKVAVEQEQACFGAAIIAGVGSGTHLEFETACSEMVRFGAESWEPDARNVALYSEWHEIFDTLDAATRQVSQRINSLVNRASEIPERV